MSYDVEFEGRFKLDKPLTQSHKRYLETFSSTRRMSRDVIQLATMPDPIREAVGLPLGIEGAYFVGSTEPNGQDYDSPSILDSNHPPQGQPGLWCRWVPDSRGEHIACDEEVNPFPNFIEWLAYLIEHFLSPWGYKISGEVRWEGEDPLDRGVIMVDCNELEVLELTQ